MASSPRNRTAAKSATAQATEAQTSASPEPQITLADVIAATQSDTGFVYTSPEFHNPLIAKGLVQINPDMQDEQGRYATRATDAAMKDTMTEQTASIATESAKPKFEIESNVTIPDRVRKSSGPRAGRAAVYPFESLELNQSFFVPNKEGANKKGEPYAPAAKAMASTVAGANAKYAEAIEGQTRTNRKGVTVPATVQTRLFKIYDTERTLPDGTVQKGARIFRVEPK